MNFLFVLMLALCSVAQAGTWWCSTAPNFNTGANDTIYVIGSADDTTGAFSLSPSMSAQFKMIGTAATDSSAIGFYPVFASRGIYAECGSVPIGNFQHKWGTMDSTDFYGVYDVSVDSVMSQGVNISPDAACPCARLVFKGLALNDSSYIVPLLSRYTE